MNLRLLTSALAVLAAAAILAAPAQAKTLDSYCSPSGDFCLEAKEKGGEVKFKIATFSFSGKYTLCVKGPSGGKDCANFKLKQDGDLFKDSVSLDRNFPDAVPGKYAVSWKLGGGKIGETLRFKL